MRLDLSTALAVIAAVAAFTPPAIAVDFRWTGGASGPNFHDPLNWSPGTTSTSWPDGTNDAAIFDTLLANFTVDWDNNHDNKRFEVRVGNPTFHLANGTIPEHYTLHTTTEAAAIVSSFPGALFSPQLTINGVENASGQSTVTTSQVLQIAIGDSTTAGTMNLNNATWNSTAATFVGLNGNGRLNIDSNAIMTSHSGVLGYASLSRGTATISGEWKNTTAELVVARRGNATLTVTGPDAYVHTSGSSNILVAEVPGSSATINVTNNAELESQGSLFVGGGPAGPGGSATVSLTNNARIVVDDTLKIWPTANMTVDNAILGSDDIDVDGSLTIQNSATLSVLDEATVGGNLTLDSIAVHLPVLTITEGGQVTFTNQFVTVDSLGSGSIDRLFLQGGTLTTGPPIEFLSSTFIGYGTLDGSVIANKGVLATGDLTMGRPDVVNAVRISEDVAFTVGEHHVTLLTKGFWDMHSFTRIMGGTLLVGNGVSMRSGLSFSGFGAIDGRMFIHGGTAIEANGGNLTLGDPTSPAGFYSDGELVVKDQVVSLRDANEAVVGSLTTLGDSSNPGTLFAANGIVVEFGKNIVGYGTVITPNDPSKPLINNGFIGGNSLSEPVTLNGYVKGVGTCDNCNILGTDAPGFSPAAVNRGSVSYNGTLEIEIGGLSPGSDFDQLNHIVGAGIADLGGTLKVDLINSFTPSAGDSFEIITAATVLDKFDIELLPTLAQDLAWIVDYQADSVSLLVSTTADFDLDGDVDGDDLTKWEGEFGGQGSDANGDGDSNGADFLAWQRQFGSGVPPLTTSQTVPEPTTHVLFTWITICLVNWRRAIIDAHGL